MLRSLPALPNSRIIPTCPTLPTGPNPPNLPNRQPSQVAQACRPSNFPTVAQPARLLPNSSPPRFAQPSQLVQTPGLALPSHFAKPCPHIFPLLRTLTALPCRMPNLPTLPTLPAYPSPANLPKLANIRISPLLRNLPTLPILVCNGVQSCNICLRFPFS